MADERIDFEDEEYGGPQKLQFQGSGTIPALAEEEMGEDDEYDDLYNDVNVGENFLQMHRSEPPAPPANVSNGGFPTQSATDSRVEVAGGAGSQAVHNPGVAAEGKYTNPTTHFQETKEGPSVVNGPEKGSAGYPDGSASLKGKAMEMPHDTQVRNMGFQGASSMSSNIAVDPSGLNRKVPIEPLPMPSTGAGSLTSVPQMPANQMGINAGGNIIHENQIRPPIDNGATMLFVGELHWWTTDAELEVVCSQYGRVKEIKFYDERASGKSKGYCQVEFYESAAAAACKEGMNGFMFNGRACVVAFASPQTIKQMASSYMNKSQNQPQAQTQARRPMNDGAGRGATMNNYPVGDGGRNFGRGGWGRGAPGVLNKAPGVGGPIRGRGGMGAKGMMGGAAGVGGGINGGGYGPGLGGPAFGGPGAGMMPPQAMMGAGFDPTYMGRGAGFGGFGGAPGFPGMLPQFPSVNTMGLAGVAPHVNPAFFGRGMAPNAMGMMGTSGMEGPGMGMWSETGMGGWGEEHGRKTRESSYGAEDGASDYGYGEASHEKNGRSSAAPREKERPSGRDWSGTSDRRHREEREQEWDRSERDHREPRHREEKDSHRDHRKRERDSGYDDDWDRGKSSSRHQSRSRAVPEEDHRSRSRDADYGKRRRQPSE
ncbi:unnamed protein product [Linum tenue]|uniref:RRM domain-containing protein n=4 Tax=Linum tenue TaxID=586396 RepID=A0AAV0NK28_9ROSI|nr:unnamed protein product [Linum tenue]